MCSVAFPLETLATKGKPFSLVRVTIKHTEFDFFQRSGVILSMNYLLCKAGRKRRGDARRKSGFYLPTAANLLVYVLNFTSYAVLILKIRYYRSAKTTSAFTWSCGMWRCPFSSLCTATSGEAAQSRKQPKGEIGLFCWPF